MLETDTNQIEVCNVVAQRNTLRLLTPPPIRFNPVSPYPTYTKYELDMRRKAEILQYNKNSTQKGRITKAQQWANLVKGQFQRNTQTEFVYDTDGNVIDTVVYNTIASCPQDKYLPTPSSSSDVPGPIVTLQYDPNVMLYNYADGENTFGIINPDITDQWKIYTSNNILSLYGAEQTLATLAIFNTDNPFTTFEINTPIGFYISGQSNNNLDSSGIFQINNFAVNIYNTGNLLSTNFIKTQSFTTKTINYYTSFNRYTSGPNIGNIIGATTFQGIQYIGNLKISNLTLSTQPGLIYDIKLQFNTVVITSIGNPLNLKTGIQTNLSQNNVPFSVINCKFSATEPPVTDPYIGFYAKEV